VIRARRLAPLIALTLLVAGCSDLVSGTGRVLGAGPTPGGASSTAPAGPPTGCPRVAYPAARLSFDCLTSDMRAFYQGTVWPVSERKTVEASSGWLLDEGAGHWGSPDGVALVDIALNVRQQMLDGDSYGSRPTVRTVVSRRTEVDGAPAYLVQTNFGINPAFARTEGTKVKQERLWIIAIRVAPNDVSLWYASVPDLVKSLWAKVPRVIDSIKVG
jgi:hypothetical protein